MLLYSKHFTFTAAIVVFALAPLVLAAELEPVDGVLARIGKGLNAAQSGSSKPAKLLLDIVEFRGKLATLPADRAAADWLALWDRARALDSTAVAIDYTAFDIETGQPVSVHSVISALPPPSVWPVLRRQAAARVKQKPDDVSVLGLRLITEVLVGDKPAFLQSLAGFEHTINAGSPDQRELKRSAIDRTRAIAYKLYGSRDQIAEAFSVSVDIQSRQDFENSVEVPDLVGLVGEARAEVLLRQALGKPVSLHVTEGVATHVLARKLALSEMAQLRKPQWGLIDDVGTLALYEALQKRFDPVDSDGSSAAADRTASKFDYLRRQADTYYFLDLIIAGRHVDAERAMARAAGGDAGLTLPKQAMAALVRAGKNEALYSYLASSLARRPQLQGWDAYLEQAAYLGRAKEAIALIDSILKRSDLAPYLRAELQRKRLDALLGADQVDTAIIGFQELLSAPPAREEEKLADRTSAAIRLAGLGRVLKKPKLASRGFDFAQRALQLPTKPNSYWRADALRRLLEELRRQGRITEAQTIVLAEIERDNGVQAGGATFAAFMVEPAKRAALIELTGIYDAAGRPTDVLRMLKEGGTWGARDVRAIVDEKDSLGTPLGLMAARAQKASGDVEAARGSVRALLDRLPGYDPAYQIFVDLYKDQAPGELDKLYADDQFEERPLIWKAIVLNANRQYADAENTVRRAIAIDPSDGEQGQNDRMRAYATLSEILEKKGDASAAKFYRGAVNAIRQSERADELHKLGLYQRAFAGYRAALEEFSDAYCIQSRLAVQLGKQGMHAEALKHYRRAYELMPDSFGRVESHCFGCESVFSDNQAQTVAEQVFTDMLKLGPTKPQAHYMLGYLRKEQGRYDEALRLFRQAVALDAEYLNAWKHLHELGEKTYVEASERDIARLKLFALDPHQRHVSYDLNEVADLSALWRALQKLAADRELNRKLMPIFPLEASIRAQNQALEKLPPEMRAQIEQFSDLKERMASSAQKRNTAPTMGQHRLMAAVLGLIGDRSVPNFID